MIRAAIYPPRRIWYLSSARAEHVRDYVLAGASLAKVPVNEFLARGPCTAVSRYRVAGMCVANHAGYPHSEIAEAFGVTRSTVCANRLRSTALAKEMAEIRDQVDRLRSLRAELDARKDAP